MFEWGWIEDLDQVATAEELARSYELVLAAEAGQFVIAAHWADLHAPEFVEDTRAAMPRLPDARSTADGCPEIDPAAGAELAVQLRRSPAAGEQLIRQALLVRHRHPCCGRRSSTARCASGSRPRLPSVARLCDSRRRRHAG